MHTIRDVAKAAGVSTATVSAVVNASAPVSDALARRVRLAIEQTGYQPDALARGLKTGASRTLGLLFHGPAGTSAWAMAAGASRAAQRQGYSLLLSIAEEATAADQLRALAARRVEGVILAGAIKPGERAVFATAAAPPLVMVGAPREEQSDSLTADYASGAEAAVAHLAGQGHRRIALSIGASFAGEAEACLAGYRRALAQHGIAFHPKLVRIGAGARQQADETARALLGGPQRPSAVLACGAPLALGLLTAVTRAGLRCPEDLSIVSFGDGDWAAATLPRLTALALPDQEIGEAAVELLLERIRTPALEPRRIALAPRLIERGSTAAPAGG